MHWYLPLHDRVDSYVVCREVVLAEEIDSKMTAERFGSGVTTFVSGACNKYINEPRYEIRVIIISMLLATR